MKAILFIDTTGGVDFMFKHIEMAIKLSEEADIVFAGLPHDEFIAANKFIQSMVMELKKDQPSVLDD